MGLWVKSQVHGNQTGLEVAALEVDAFEQAEIQASDTGHHLSWQRLEKSVRSAWDSIDRQAQQDNSRRHQHQGQQNLGVAAQQEGQIKKQKP